MDERRGSGRARAGAGADPAAALRAGRAAGVRRRAPSRDPADAAGALRARRRRTSTSCPASSTTRACSRSPASTCPSCATRRGRRSTPPALDGDANIFDAIRAGDLLVHHPVRKLRRQRRAVHPRRGRRSAHRRDQDDGVSRRRRHAVRALADQGGRSGQAGRLRHRAEGAVRRGAQPALGRGARTGRRPRHRGRRRA